MLNKCLAEGCNRKVQVKKHALCRAHAERFYTGREVNEDIRKRKKNRKIEPFSKE